jgi:hypothetical protein
VIVSKLEFSDKLGISPGRVSQFLRSGMPERDDGRLDFEEALKWLSATVDGKAGFRASVLLKELGAGSSRSRRLNDVPTDRDNPVVLACPLALGLLFSQIPRIARESAKEAGAPGEIVEKVDQIAYRLAVAAGDQVSNEYLRLPPREDWPTLDMCRRFAEEEK